MRSACCPQVAAWFTEAEERTGMAVCRLKNTFTRSISSHSCRKRSRLQICILA